MKKFVPFLLSLLILLTLPLQTMAASLDEVISIIESDYVGDIQGNLDSAKSIDEVMEMLDPYSAYFTAEEYNAFLDSVDLKTVGIGIVIEKHEKGILIVDVVETGSAINSGIEAGDIITEVDGKSTVNISTEEAQTLLLGEENTKVDLTILKKDGTIIHKLLTRQSFALPNVTTGLLYGNVGYIALSSFSEDGAKLVKEAYNDLVNQGATSFILDLQYNGGGYVATAEELIGLFPNASYAYKVKYSTGSEMIRAISQEVNFPKNTRLLVNRYSASASEMTAAALLDQDAAIIYGEQTYGKGTMQGFYQFRDGSVLKLTIAEFFGPKGTVVKDVGLTPDIVTKSNPLYQAHFDTIAANLSNYKKLPSLENVPTTKTFKVTFSKDIKQQIAENAVELVELGGDKVEVSLKANNAQLEVTPVEPLKAGSQYILIFHPTIQDIEGKNLKTGQYLHITVQEEK